MQMKEILPNLYLSGYHQVEILENAFIVNCTKNLDMLNDNGMRIAIDDDKSTEALDA